MSLLTTPRTGRRHPVPLSPGVDRRIAFLHPAERKLLEISLGSDFTRREIATLLGTSAGTITRRLRNILARLHRPIVAALVERGDLLPELYKEIGLAYFLRRTSIHQIARQLQLSPHRVTMIIQYLKGWLKGAR